MDVSSGARRWSVLPYGCWCQRSSALKTWARLSITSFRAWSPLTRRSTPIRSCQHPLDVVLRGIGGHGARPQEGKDPIVMAGEFIVQLQTIVSRQENPRDPAVVT